MRAEKTLFALWVAAVVAVTLALMILFGGFAGAAEMPYCRAYARDYSQMVIKYIWYRAYSGCLNSMEDPELPIDWQAALKKVLPTATPLPAERPGPPPGSVPASGPVDALADPPPDLSAIYKQCAASHPRGWDAKTKTVTKLVRGTWIRVKCELLP